MDIQTEKTEQYFICNFMGIPVKHHLPPIVSYAPPDKIQITNTEPTVVISTVTNQGGYHD